MTRDSGERYGASTETSSTPCNVRKTAGQVAARAEDVRVVLPHFVDTSLILFPPENREDMLRPSSNKLTEVLEEANKLFKDGMFG